MIQIIWSQLVSGYRTISAMASESQPDPSCIFESTTLRTICSHHPLRRVIHCSFGVLLFFPLNERRFFAHTHECRYSPWLDNWSAHSSLAAHHATIEHLLLLQMPDSFQKFIPSCALCFFPLYQFHHSWYHTHPLPHFRSVLLHYFFCGCKEWFRQWRHLLLWQLSKSFSYL